MKKMNNVTNKDIERSKKKLRKYRRQFNEMTRLQKVEDTSISMLKTSLSSDMKETNNTETINSTRIELSKAHARRHAYLKEAMRIRELMRTEERNLNHLIVKETLY